MFFCVDLSSKYTSLKLTRKLFLVKVCARIRNQTNRDEESCIEIVNDTTIRIVGIDNKVVSEALLSAVLF